MRCCLLHPLASSCKCTSSERVCTHECLCAYVIMRACAFTTSGSQHMRADHMRCCLLILIVCPCAHTMIKGMEPDSEISASICCHRCGKFQHQKNCFPPSSKSHRLTQDSQDPLKSHFSHSQDSQDSLKTHLSHSRLTELTQDSLVGCSDNGQGSGNSSCCIRCFEPWTRHCRIKGRIPAICICCLPPHPCLHFIHSCGSLQRTVIVRSGFGCSNKSAF